MTRENQIRKEILFQAYAKRPLHVTASGIHKQCRKEQMDFSEAEIKRELAYELGKGALQKTNTLDGSEIAYEITAAGVDYYEQNYAA